MNNKIYDLKYKSGPHGDECTTYSVIFYKEDITLQEFITNVVNNNLLEWGSFYIQIKDPELEKLDYLAPNECYSEIEITYKYGEIHYKTETKFDNIIWDMYIDANKNNWANGGWSNMDYWIWLK